MMEDGRSMGRDEEWWKTEARSMGRDEEWWKTEEVWEGMKNDERRAEVWEEVKNDGRRRRMDWEGRLRDKNIRGKEEKCIEDELRGQGKGGKWKGEGNCKEKKRKWVEDRLGRQGKGGKWKGQRGGGEEMDGKEDGGEKVYNKNIYCVYPNCV